MSGKGLKSCVTDYPSYQYNFGALEEPAEPKATILPIPYGYTASYGPSVREGPGAIIKVSRNLEVYDEELLIPIDSLSIKTLPFMEPSAAGPEDMIRRIAAAVQKAYKPETLLVPIGGEHTITIGVVQALQKIYKSLSVLVLDAHDDLRDEYESSRFSHACVVRRLSEICTTSVIGVRSISTLADKRPDNVQIVTARQFKKGDNWTNLIKEMTEPVYISCDLDVFDPAIMPAVGNPEPDGLNWQEVTSIIKFAIKNNKVIGADFVELAPISGIVASDFTAAKLIMRTVGYWTS